MAGLVLNLGCGKKIFDDAINVDISPARATDIQVDLSCYPWPWADESVDGIHASHIIEHFLDPKRFIEECHRILKKGGFLRLVVPHASCVSAVGCLGHYRTYCYGTLKKYLDAQGGEAYLFGQKKFETVYQRLNWWYEDTDAEGNLSKWLQAMVRGADFILTPLINISPRTFENFWWPWVGGAREVVWVGIKVEGDK